MEELPDYVSVIPDLLPVNQVLFDLDNTLLDGNQAGRSPGDARSAMDAIEKMGVSIALLPGRNRESINACAYPSAYIQVALQGRLLACSNGETEMSEIPQLEKLAEKATPFLDEAENKSIVSYAEYGIELHCHEDPDRYEPSVKLLTGMIKGRADLMALELASSVASIALAHVNKGAAIEKARRREKEFAGPSVLFCDDKNDAPAASEIRRAGGFVALAGAAIRAQEFGIKPRYCFPSARIAQGIVALWAKCIEAKPRREGFLSASRSIAEDKEQ